MGSTEDYFYRVWLPEQKKKTKRARKFKKSYRNGQRNEKK